MLTILMAAARGAPAQDHSLPDAADAVAAFDRTTDWTHAFTLPALDNPGAVVPIADAAGVCVTLRLQGRVVGTGIDMQPDDLMLRRAVGRALNEVLGHPTVAALRAQAVRNDDSLGADDIERHIGQRLTVDLDLAGEFKPLPGRSEQQIAEQLEPGIDGVALRRDDRYAVFFPSQLLAMNRAGEIARMLPGLANELGLRPAPLSELIRSHDVSVYRFRTIRLLQTDSRAIFMQAARSGTLVGSDDITTTRIRQFADDLASHLIARAAEAPNGIMGDYDPVADSYDPLVAGPVAQSLSALALAQYASTPGVDTDIAAEARSTAVGLLNDLDESIATDDTDHSRYTRTAAIVILAQDALTTQSTPTNERIASWARARVESVVDSILDDSPPEGLGAHGRAMIAAAVTVISDDADRARRVVDLTWKDTPPSLHVALLPWILWAEARLDNVTRPELDAVRRSLDAARISRNDRPDAPDLHGGFDLRPGSTRKQADSQTTRPACAVAGLIRRPGAVPGNQRFLLLGRHLETMRFLVQLQADEIMMITTPNPQRVHGGLRNAPWDLRQPVSAQAMGLLAGVETLRALDDLTRSPPGD